MRSEDRMRLEQQDDEEGGIHLVVYIPSNTPPQQNEQNEQNEQNDDTEKTIHIYIISHKYTHITH